MRKNFVTLYANNGCLGAELRTIYSYNAPVNTAVVSEEITVRIPAKFWEDGWTLGENYMGIELLCSPWGWNYTWNDVLEGDEIPCIYAIDADGIGHRYRLTEFVYISREKAREIYDSGADIFGLPEGLPLNNIRMLPTRISNACEKSFEEMDATARENLCFDAEMGENMQYYQEVR